MQDATWVYGDRERGFQCPECGAVLLDELAMSAHREGEHQDEAAGTAERPESEPEKAALVHRLIEEGASPADPPEHRGVESPRPREPAP